MEITTAEMYSGIGGVRLGLEQSNNFEATQTERNQEPRRDMPNNPEQLRGRTHSFRCVWANDIDKYACQIYRKNFGDKELVEDDIRTIDPNTIPDHKLLTAGFPYPSFSLAGKREGFNDVRGTLFFEVVRIAKAKRPPLLLLENVKGLLSNDQGRTFGTILEELGNIGYWCEWQTLNSKYFGVPQNRERVFIIGHLRGTSTRQIFPIGESNSISAQNAPNGQRIASCLDANYHKGARRQRTFVINESENQLDVYYRVHAPNSPEKRWGKHHIKTSVCPTLSTDLAIEPKDDPVLAVEMAHTKANMKEGRFSKDCHSLDGGKSKAVMIANTLDRDGYLRTGARPRDENGKPQLLPIGYRRIRRLTPIECERLQGFPDGWTEGVSDTQRYKLLGNAVTTNVIEFIGKHLTSLFCS